MKKVSILGSTGSIGSQSLDVIRQYQNDFEIEALVAGSNGDLLVQQALEFMPKTVGIVDESKYEAVRDALPDAISVISGKDAANQVAHLAVDIAICAIVGMAGLDSFLTCLDNAKRVGLANKEAMVCGGDLVGENAHKIVPIDSEHSAIFQCLQGNRKAEIRRILLTGSGGPFRDLPIEKFPEITVDQALHHPNWSMGHKITIDSATMMNKGLEVIEAVRLFGVEKEKVQVLVHKESIIHSMVDFIDGSVMAQMGYADMRVPIQYALTYPDRKCNNLVKPLDLLEIASLHFEAPHYKRFPCLEYAYTALERGTMAMTALNAANEAAVALFLRNKIRFVDIANLVRYGMLKAPDVSVTLENIHQTHDETIREILGSFQKLIK